MKKVAKKIRYAREAPTLPAAYASLVKRAPATATPPDEPRLTAALVEIERLKDEIREAAVKHETKLERVWRLLSGGG